MADVVVVRGRSQVIHPGIGGLAGGVDLALEDVAQSVETGSTHAGADHEALDLGVVLDPAHFEGVGAVVNDDDLIKVGGNEVDEVLLRLAGLQIGHAGGEVVVIAVVGVKSVGVLGALLIGAVHDSAHIVGQISALAAAAGQHQNSGVRECLCVGNHLVGIRSSGGLGQSPVLTVVDGDSRTVGAVSGVEIAQLGVGVEACVLQAGEQVHSGGNVHRAGAGAAVDGIGGSPAKDVDVGGVGQRQSAVIVLQQDDALGRNFLHHLAGVLSGLGSDVAGVAQRHLEGVAHRAEADHVDHDAKEQHECDGRLPARKAALALRHLLCGDHERDPCHKADHDDRQRDLDHIQRTEYVFPCDLNTSHVFLLLIPGNGGMPRFSGTIIIECEHFVVAACTTCRSGGILCKNFKSASNFIVLIHNSENGFIVHHAKSKNSPSR